MKLVFLLACGIFALVFLLLAVGNLFSNKCIRGSCGGVMVRDSDGEPISCATCPNKNKQKTSARANAKSSNSDHNDKVLDPIEDY
ncbi:hypothetical protein COTS27_00489 [Spirochaetota bacterium]|nr:hypothetical protein COTS27_00489 [Spirochaetota bacterium]